MDLHTKANGLEDSREIDLSAERLRDAREQSTWSEDRLASHMLYRALYDSRKRLSEGAFHLAAGPRDWAIIRNGLKINRQDVDELTETERDTVNNLIERANALIADQARNDARKLENACNQATPPHVAIFRERATLEREAKNSWTENGKIVEIVHETGERGQALTTIDGWDARLGSPQARQHARRWEILRNVEDVESLKNTPEIRRRIEYLEEFAASRTTVLSRARSGRT